MIKYAIIAMLLFASTAAQAQAGRFPCGIRLGCDDRSDYNRAMDRKYWEDMQRQYFRREREREENQERRHRELMEELLRRR
jgi:hypothetical protein